jgi:hypothetical protein
MVMCAVVFVVLMEVSMCLLTVVFSNKLGSLNHNVCQFGCDTKYSD